jgi:cytochrome P450
MSGILYDPFDPLVLADPYPHYAALRRASAVHAVPSLGMKVVCRYADAVSVLRRPEMFSSSPYQDFIRAAMEIGAARVAVGGETLLGSDPPVHTRLRKLVNRGFTHARTLASGRNQALDGEPLLADGARSVGAEIEIPTRLVLKGETGDCHARAVLKLDVDHRVGVRE